MSLEPTFYSRIITTMRELAVDLYDKGISPEEALPLIRQALLEKFPQAFDTSRPLQELDAEILPFLPREPGRQP